MIMENSQILQLSAGKHSPRVPRVILGHGHPGSVDRGAVAVVSGDAIALRQRFTQQSRG
jgi:hypothetical protein